MANNIKVKRSATPAKVPTTTDLELGEIAVNTYDGKMYIKKDDGTASIVQIGAGGAGTGDVVGPASATDNAIVRFDTTTGKLIQNSTITVDDNGNIINVNSVGLDVTPATVPVTVGTMSWDDGEGMPEVLLKGGNTTLKVGAQEYARVYNDSGAILTKGQAVYIFGAQGNRISVKLARANLEATSYGTLGLVSETIGIGAEGYIIVSGALYKIDTTGFTAGSTVYLSPTTAGAITNTKPQAPNQLVIIGFVERVDNIVGSIYVKIDNGYELDELHDVQITSPQSGNILIYDASTTPIGVWKNANLSDGTGISITEGAGSITVTNTGVTSITGTASQITTSASTGGVTLSLPSTINVNTSGTASNVTGTVAIANGGTGSTTATAALAALGAYPASNPNGYTSNTGTVTSVSATSGTGISITGSPITTSGTLNITNTAPDQVVSLTQGGATTITGTYPNFTISSVNTTYSLATSTTLGLIELGSDTAQTVAANAVTATASRTYALQVNAAGQGVINVPWTDTNSGGTVTSVGGTGTVNGISLSGTVTSSGNLTLGGTLSGVSLTTQVSGTLPIANGGTGATTAANALTSLGAYAASNPSGYTSNTGTVTSIIAGTGLSGGTITTSGTIALANTTVTAGSYTNASITVDAQGRLTAASTGSSGGVTTFSAGTTGLTPSTATSGAVTLSGTLAVANGGTGVTTSTGTGSTVRSASPTFTGTPLSTTAAENTRTTQIATTAFCNPASSKATNGYHKLPDGVIIQWGFGTTSAGGSVSVTWPIAFPSAVRSVQATANASGAVYANVNNCGLTSGTLQGWIGATGAGTAVGIFYVAIGY